MTPRIRWADRADVPMIEAIFRAQGLDYKLPALFPPTDYEMGRGAPNPARNTVVRLVAVDEENAPRMAIIGKRFIEAYFLIDHAWGTPGERYDAFLALHNAACDSGRMLGYEEAQAQVPTELEQSFGRRLAQLAWEKYVWPTYTRAL